MDFLTVVQLFDMTVRLAIPLLLACLAGLFSERAGIFDIGLEGKMLGAAMMAGAVAAVTGDVWLGMLAGIGTSVALAGIHGLASITFRGDQLISGVAINFLAAGLTVVVAQDWFAQGGRTPSLSGDGRFGPIELPFALGPKDAAASDQSLFELIAAANPIQQVYSELISGHSLLVYAALTLVPLSWWLLYRTRFGLRLRAVGEAPEAVDTAGISVIGIRFAAVLMCGVLCGIAGAYLSTALQAGFVKDMTAGRGFIALAALIFAKWRPWHALSATFLFGFLQAVAVRFQNVDIGGVVVPVQFMDALPFILTVVILAGFGGKAIPPRAGGQPYVKEQ